MGIMDAFSAPSTLALTSSLSLILGFILSSVLRRGRNNNLNSAASSLQSPAWASSREEFKMVIGARTDLKMGKGKMAAQCCHGAVGAYKAVSFYPKALRNWSNTGQAKIVVKLPDEDALFDVVERAKATGIPYYVISDAGRTQIAAGSRTVVAVGPAPASMVDKVTGHLSLM